MEFESVVGSTEVELATKLLERERECVCVCVCVYWSLIGYIGHEIRMCVCVCLCVYWSLIGYIGHEIRWLQFLCGSSVKLTKILMCSGGDCS